MIEQERPRASRMVNSVCVFCGSHAGARSDYVTVARDLGTCLAHVA